MLDFYVYMVDLPPGINEAVMPCSDGTYTIYIDMNLPDNKLQSALEHAIKHIENNDHEKQDVQEIEAQSHNNNT